MRDRTYTPKSPKRKYRTTQDEIDSIRQDAKNAKDLLENSFLMSYLANRKNSILEIHAKQSIYDRSESTTNNGITDTVIIPAKKEYTLLAGEYRFVDKLIADLEQSLLLAKGLDEKIKNDQIDIEETPSE